MRTLVATGAANSRAKITAAIPRSLFRWNDSNQSLDRTPDRKEHPLGHPYQFSFARASLPSFCAFRCASFLFAVFGMWSAYALLHTKVLSRQRRDRQTVH